MVVGVVSLLSAGVLFAQQPQAKSSATPAATTQPAAQQQNPQAQTQAKPKTSKAKAAAAKWTKEQITEAQDGLKRAKVYNGPATGVLGRATRRAIRATKSTVPSST